MKYRAQITCGIGFDSLEPNYEKRYTLIVEDTGINEPLNPIFYPTRRYRTECKFCKREIDLPSTINEINLSVKSYMDFNNTDYRHSVRVVSVDPIIGYNEEVLDVTDIHEEDEEDESVSTLTALERRRVRRLAEEERLRNQTNERLESNRKSMELLWKIVIGCLFLSAFFKFLDVILKYSKL